MMAPLERTELLTVRMSAEEIAMLKRLADADGLSASDIIRQFIRRTHAERFGSTPPAAPKKRKR
jgi:hypothetical protein